MTPSHAKAIAETAHARQRYGKRKYIEHVRDVVWRVQRDPRTSPDASVVAWLHDVVEDGHSTIEQLMAGEHGLTRVQREALRAITRAPDEPYGRYLARVCRNQLAALVKLHDIDSNQQAAEPPPELAERYRKARPIVRDALQGVVYCKTRNCRAPIVFLATPTGKQIPVDRSSLPETFDREALVYDPHAGHVTHFATCPDPFTHRRRRR